MATRPTVTACLFVGERAEEHWPCSESHDGSHSGSQNVTPTSGADVSLHMFIIEIETHYNGMEEGTRNNTITTLNIDHPTGYQQSHQVTGDF